MSQYDAIGTKYNTIHSLPLKQLEQADFRSAVQPFLSQSHTSVIDFACGTGFYSEQLLAWGAAHVTGIDLSPSMVAGANSRLAPDVAAGRARFVVGDGTEARSYAPGGASVEGFDVATGAWFLNYASSQEQLATMFRAVALNLKPAGVFVGIVPPPSDDVAGVAEVFNRPPLSELYPRIEYTAELESGEGWHTHIFADDQGVDFWAWHLKKSVYEEAARQGGMMGRVEWRTKALLGPEWRDKFDLPPDAWKVVEEWPHRGILVVWKE